MSHYPVTLTMHCSNLAAAAALTHGETCKLAMMNIPVHRLTASNLDDYILRFALPQLALSENFLCPYNRHEHSRCHPSGSNAQILGHCNHRAISSYSESFCIQLYLHRCVQGHQYCCATALQDVFIIQLPSKSSAIMTLEAHEGCLASDPSAVPIHWS